MSTITLPAEVETFEAVVVGAGTAGLSAALFLSRARRRTLVFDGGPTRNAVTKYVHEYPGHEGFAPAEVQARARAEVTRYGGEIRTGIVQRIESQPDGRFHLWSDQGLVVAEAVVLATGLVDVLPPVPGLRESWGKDTHVCPCFSGYEVQDQRLVVFGLPERMAQAGKFLTGWSRHVTLVTPQAFDPAVTARLRAAGVTVVQDEVAALVSEDGHLVSVMTAGGTSIACDGVFVSVPMRAASPLAATLCEVDADGFAVVDANGKTSRAGVWAIGNASDPMGHLVHAAAAGAQAGPHITDFLIEQSIAKALR